MQYHVPRKMLIIHQYRPDGDGFSDPYDPGQTEIADKRNLLFDPRVDVVIHIDSVDGYPGDIRYKTLQYSQWIEQDMEKYHNFLCGGFKLFYQHEARVRLMTPKEVLSLNPPPMVVTYGNQYASGICVKTLVKGPPQPDRQKPVSIVHFDQLYECM